jgi:hypothetical protein
MSVEKREAMLPSEWMVICAVNDRNAGGKKKYAENFRVASFQFDSCTTIAGLSDPVKV